MNERAQEIEDLVLGLSPEWEKRMALTHWKIEHYFLDTLYVAEPVTNNFMVGADTECEWSYLMARVNWYMPSVIRHDNDRIERTLVHELCHVALSPEQNLIDTYVEKAQIGEGAEEKSLIEKLMYERMELATESMAKSVMRAWKHHDARA